MKGWRFREFQAELLPPIHTGIIMPFIAYQAILFTHPPGKGWQQEHFRAAFSHLNLL
ncbi:hypothetical protein C8R26_10890 [Nitrosomonas oligotropha]|uniref:Uncharacterized protein n=1 Tax=Nitrosomonas oligotropha TaxID=42354 RepID=A0A2T5I0U4_9PROT|nr:hypothetical protein C8R26_10890 [Nitrosomonas oligotropha]